jgi:hypothetical protein
MVVNEVNKFGQIFPIHRRWKYKDIPRVSSILLISPPKVIYAELFCVKDTPHFFPNLFQNHPVYWRRCTQTFIRPHTRTMADNKFRPACH